MDVVLAERPDVMQVISNAQNVQTATDIMLRGYENGGGTINTLASKEQMDKIYGKWNNGYDKQMSRRLGNANNLLGIAPTTYEIPQTFFDDINSQLNIPHLGVSQDEDPELRYKAPVIDETLFAKPKPLDIEVEDTDKQDRLQRINTFNTIMGLMGQQSPLAGFGSGSQDTGMMAAVNSIYSNKFDRGAY